MQNTHDLLVGTLSIGIPSFTINILGRRLVTKTTFKIACSRFGNLFSLFLRLQTGFQKEMIPLR